jgi:RNA polymerase sigma-70 factor (ECF subfamily)
MNTVPDDELENFKSDDLDPETRMLKNVDKESIHLALDSLPTEYREVLILREFEGLSYREIADMSELPIGTVMSRLARARKRLQQSLFNRNLQEVGIGS